MTKDDVLRKVRGLLRLANSANAGEAATAAKHAQRLIAEHGLTAALAEVSADVYDDEPVIDYHAKNDPLYTSNKTPTWVGRLAVALAKYNGCYVFGRGVISIVGRPSDVGNVRYLFHWLTGECDRLTRREGAGCGRSWCNDFRNGFVSGVADALKAARQAAVDDFTKTQASRTDVPQTTAIVLAQNAIARYDERTREAERFARSAYKLGSGRRVRFAGTGGFASGREHGRRVNVNGGGRALPANRRALA